jgi:glycosyltransferase involved in cell wall biosynthesis
MSDTEMSVTIVIPTYNRAYIVGRAIQSVLDQIYQDLEIVVVDDGSKDNTEQVAKSSNDKTIRHIKHERNEVVAAARNTGIKGTKSKYISYPWDFVGEVMHPMEHPEEGKKIAEKALRSLQAKTWEQPAREFRGGPSKVFSKDGGLEADK